MSRIAPLAAGWQQRLANLAGPLSATSGGSTPTLVLVYDPTLSRVRLSVSGLNAAATTAVIDRSTNGAQWTTVRGGTATPVLFQSAAVDDYEFPSGLLITYRVRSYSASGGLLDTVTGTITATLATVWLKFAGRPWLNTSVTVTDWTDPSREGRGGLFPVSGRSLPVAVTDVASSRQWTLEIMLASVELATDMDTRLAGGDLVLIHVPTGCPVPGGWVYLNRIGLGRKARRSDRRYLGLSVTEAAPPPPGIIGSTATYTTVLNTYATYTDLLAAHTTYASVLELVAEPSEVIVP